MTKKHKELLALAETRSKELNDYLNERGDNITAKDLDHAHAIRDDLKKIKGDIEAEKEIDAKRSSVSKELTEFRSWMDDPAGDPAIHRIKVLGSSRAGETTITRGGRSASHRRAIKVLEERGAGILNAHNGYHPNAGVVMSDPEYKRAMCLYLTRGPEAADRHFRNLEEGLDPQGGYLAPVEVIAKLIEKKPTPTRVSGLVDVVNSSRDAISLPRVNYTTASDDSSGTIYNTGFRATLTDENPTSDTQAMVNDTSIFGSVRVSVFTWLIEGVLTNNQVEDAMFDPMAWMTDKFGLTIELLRDNMILNGTGVSQPLGLLANPGGSDTLTYPPTVSSGSPASPFISADGILNLTEDVPEQYDENVKYLYKKTSTGKVIRTLKDANGRYLFSKGPGEDTLVPAKQRLLNGYPVLWSQFMPDPASSGTGQYPVIAGDFGGYTLVNRVGFSIQVLREVAARRNQVIVLGRVRFGGQPLEPWRLRVMKVGA